MSVNTKNALKRCAQYTDANTCQEGCDKAQDEAPRNCC